ncbi:glycosyltransferase family 4 protein [Pontibacter qinzhouensis]|uniref:Glycosyltransferase family 4 protein n=1 Tax=Pontibacter qinzhouensis TaxID=2603253 RepID=A0A5C8JIB3_9BACT|nr:glycosyltransferase family 1 protein [Pontibacter qinzhouensis]TXK37398.1 glycosyltransferase family 4 protein [Pontibacter qinzhouensis]
MIRIGYDAKRAFNNTSGLGNYSRFVISSQLEHNPEQEYRLFTPKVNTLFKDFYPATPTAQVVLPQPGLQKRLASLWRVFGMASTLRSHQINLYHGLSNELPYGLTRAGVKSVVTIHDLIFLRFPELYKPLDRLIYTQKVKYACQQSDHIVSISEQTRQDLITYLKIDGSRISVVYQDCDPVFHQPLSPEHLQQVKTKFNLPHSYIVCVGTLEKRKNQLQLLKAWHQQGLADAAHVVFVGRKTPYAAELENFVQQHGLQAKVHFLPYISFQELPAIFQLARLFVYPSIFEGFGIPIVEALNSGVPVITSTGSCFQEAGGPKSLYANPADATALGNQMAKALTDEALRQEMIRAGHVHVQQFRAAHTAAQLQQLYERVLQK